jgi:hypothetical protein
MPNDSALSRFLLHSYPYMHIKIYNAICGNEKFRRAFPKIIEDLNSDPKSAPRELRNEANKYSSEAAHALRILANLADKGNVNILSQLRNAATCLIIDESIDAIVIQVIHTDRWSKEYGVASYDLLLAIPELSKTIAISTRDMDVPMEPIIPRLTKIRLQNVHLYSFFNRAHCVKGRRIYSPTKERICIPLIPKDFMPYMRTCEDTQTIGSGMALNYFTPFETLDGLRLGFFFALVCKVTDTNWVSSPDGRGSTLDHVWLTLTDKTGDIDVRISTEVFTESLESPLQPRKINIVDPLDLATINEEVFVIGAWILGKQFPEIVFLSLIDNEIDAQAWQITSFLNSHRKAPKKYIVNKFGKNLFEDTLSKTNCVFSTNDWSYYKEHAWPESIFSAMVQNGFNYRLGFSEALKYGASYIDYKVWSENFARFFAVNPNIIELYRSKEPLELFEKIHGIPQKEKEAAVKYQVTLQINSPMVPFYTLKKQDIIRIAASLSQLGYTVWDLFSPEWNNGGLLLERRWLHISRKHKDDLASAITFILSMRMEVRVPEIAVKNMNQKSLP